MASGKKYPRNECPRKIVQIRKWQRIKKTNYKKHILLQAKYSMASQLSTIPTIYCRGPQPVCRQTINNLNCKYMIQL